MFMCFFLSFISRAWETPVRGGLATVQLPEARAAKGPRGSETHEKALGLVLASLLCPLLRGSLALFFEGIAARIAGGEKDPKTDSTSTIFPEHSCPLFL